MAIFDDWCNFVRQQSGLKELWSLTEKPGGRAVVEARLVHTVRSHYDDLARIADDIEALGYARAAGILRERLPRTSRSRSGELGEILATELVEEKVGFAVPVRRLRYKDGREMALRGDDLIGVKDDAGQTLHLLKGESKSRKSLGAATIAQARETLTQDTGRPTATSLLFTADRLLEHPNAVKQALGRRLRDEVVNRALPAARITHVLFALCGNDPVAALTEDLNGADNGRPHVSACLRIEDHQEFIAAVYTGASDLGDG